MDGSLRRSWYLVRKSFTPSEMYEITEAVRAVVEERAREGQVAALNKGTARSGQFPPRGTEIAKSRDVLASRVGASGRTLDKIKTVVEAAQTVVLVRTPRCYRLALASLQNRARSLAGSTP